MADAPRSHAKRILTAITRVARGRADGLALFGNTPQSFLASLAPQLAFPLVGGLMMMAGGGGLRALTDLLASLCLLLAPQVLSFELARWWQREAAWCRFATAFNWCQWILPVLGLVLLMVANRAVALGVSPAIARAALIGALGCYGMWLHWFLARMALGLSAGRSALFVVCVNVGTLLIVVLPRLLVQETP